MKVIMKKEIKITGKIEQFSVERKKLYMMIILMKIEWIITQ